MKQIKLTKNQVALVDDEDFDYLNQWKWYAMWSRNTKSYYAARKENSKSILMHRFIMTTPSEKVCDHINHDTLDNQKDNLRNITNSENLMNRRSAQSNNKLREKNIRVHYGGFEVYIMKDKKFVFTKTYRTLNEAKDARDAAIQKFHGEFGSVL